MLLTIWLDLVILSRLVYQLSIAKEVPDISECCPTLATIAETIEEITTDELGIYKNCLLDICVLGLTRKEIR